MCGILALYNYPNKKPINTTIQEHLLKLQHRGQDSHGYYLTNYKKDVLTTLKPGLVKFIDNISSSNELYEIGLGHTRYATSYKTENKNPYLLEHIQPIFIKETELVFCFNGNINNLQSVIDTLEINIETNKLDKYNDSLLLKEIFLQKDVSTPEKLEEILRECIKKIKGVFNLIIYHGLSGNLYACKDVTGNRPLCIGKNSDGFCFASESVALGEYTYIRELEAGELVRFNSTLINVETIYLENKKLQKKHICLFEYIYLQRKDSLVNIQNTKKIQVEDLRIDFGEELARQEFLKIDKSNKKNIVVIGAPSTGIPIGVSFAKQLDIPYHQFIQKRRGAPRSFIEANNQDRLAVCRRKFLVDDSYSIENKIVFFVDDSLVRGNTIYSIMELLKTYNPKEIHFRIASPEVKNPCYFGIDIPTQEELIMNKYTPPELAKYLGVDSIQFLQPENMAYALKKSLPVSNSDICMGCFTGKYSKHLEF